MPVTTDYFKKLCELCQTFGTARNRRELLEMIFASAMEILEGKAACLYLLEPGKPELMPVAQKGLSESYFRSKKSMLVEKIVPLVLKKGFFYCRDAAADPKLEYPDAKKAEGIASIRLLDETKETLELVAAFGLSKKYLQKGPVSAQKSIAQAMKNGKPVIILDAATDRRVQYRAMNQEEGIVTILAVPIKTKEKVIGVLRLYTKAVRHFTAEEIKLVTALAYLGGLAIQNASLYLLCQTEMKDLQEELWSHRSWF
ncbi:MAG TPA: GAF domain-containing protein [Desulfobaccales bacterium]|nr:GAF domain-containing protein [Desulfobaccales bacterium]